MQLRKPLLMIGHFFLVMAFLITSVVDNMHALKMLASETSDLQTPIISLMHGLAMAKQAPCHEATLISTESPLSGPMMAADSNDKNPCCPYDECSPDNCLMHMAIASLTSLEIIPHSPPAQRTFLLSDIAPVSLPFSKRLRPPIG